MIDLILGAVVLVSGMLGWLRGFVGIVVGTLSWLLAGWAALQFGAAAGLRLTDGALPSATATFGGYALVFFGVLVAVAFVGRLVRAGVQAVQMNSMDRSLGFALGLVRGVLLACVLVLLLEFTPLPAEPSWRQSHLLLLLEPVVGWMRGQVPDWRVAVRHLGKLAPPSDNMPSARVFFGPGRIPRSSKAISQ